MAVQRNTLPVRPKRKYGHQKNVMSIESILNATPPRKSERPPRYKYHPEEAYFVWYHRVDLRLPWDKVVQLYRRQFAEDRRKGGLQCKFYRVLDSYGIAKTREQSKHNKLALVNVDAFGMVERTGIRYGWMRPEHRGHHPMLRPRL